MTISILADFLKFCHDPIFVDFKAFPVRLFFIRIEAVMSYPTRYGAQKTDARRRRTDFFKMILKMHFFTCKNRNL